MGRGQDEDEGHDRVVRSASCRSCMGRGQDAMVMATMAGQKRFMPVLVGISMGRGQDERTRAMLAGQKRFMPVLHGPGAG
ncbi:hypothetical protein PAPYR_7708 [Paratrimastix pyriformis]|uniref:Uncharacterized protein n=1 Tax=Paratrimastix pyriformis TaxID=342808 RepID=A0ABQ8UC88_9EUKA|nr:hypothetical protein PAPYR_7708 [Paratrimastix pyriformis]